jgi:ABC-type glutathione transport system ATPase component
LDDVLSGLDSRNARLIEENLFSEGGYCRRAGISVILVTHSCMITPAEELVLLLLILTLVAPYADQVIVLQEGSVFVAGSYEDIIAQVPGIHRMSLATRRSGNTTRWDSLETTQEALIAETSSKEQKASPVGLSEDDLTRRDGSWGVYRYYISSAGLWTTISFAFCSLASAFFGNFVSKSSSSPNRRGSYNFI